MRRTPSTGMLAGSSPSGKWAQAARTRRQVLVLPSRKWALAAHTRRLVLVLQRRVLVRPSGKRAARTRRLVLVLQRWVLVRPSGTWAARTRRPALALQKCGLVKMNKRTLTQFHSECVSFPQHRVLPDPTIFRTPIWTPYYMCNLSCRLPQARAQWRSREERRSPLAPQA